MSNVLSGRGCVLDRPDPLSVLTPTEQQVLRAMASGLSNQGISNRMFLSAKTVECHVGAIFRKLGLQAETSGNRRVQAVVAWLRATGAVPPA